MNELDTLDTLLRKDPEAMRRKVGIPHPLSKFAGPNFVDGFFADLVLDFIHDTVFKDPTSNAYKGAIWFLLESEQAYFFACEMAGLDATRLRAHLRNKIPTCG